MGLGYRLIMPRYWSLGIVKNRVLLVDAWWVIWSLVVFIIGRKVGVAVGFCCLCKCFRKSEVVLGRGISEIRNSVGFSRGLAIR